MEKTQKKSYETPAIEVVEVDWQPMLQTGTGTTPTPTLPPYDSGEGE